METITNGTGFFDMDAAPMRIGKVRLKVRDLDAVSRYYQTVLGLDEISKSARQAVSFSAKLEYSTPAEVSCYRKSPSA